MKPYPTPALIVLSAALLFAACSKDDIDASSTAATTPSTDTSSGDENVEEFNESSFDRTITLTWTSSGVTKSGDENNVVSISGTAATVDNTGTSEKVIYVLSGSCSDGSLKLYSNNKQALKLSGLSLSCSSGAAINNQGKKSCYVIVSGTNTLSDSSSAAYSASGSEDMKAVFFSEGQLLFSGSGSLTVTAANAQGKAGITSDDYVWMDGPTVKITAGSSAGHGLRGKEFVAVNGGSLDISVAAAMKKGITSDSLVVFNGGTTSVKVTGGTAYDSDDKEYKASAGVKADQVFKMNDGTLTVTNSGQGGKGISSDLQGYFNGGTVKVTVSGSNYGSSSSGMGGPGGWGGWGSSSSSSDNSVAAKGIKFDGNLVFAGGTVSVTAKSHEAIESKGTIEVKGGRIFAQSSDDAINAASHLTISDGYVCAYSTGNDGLDSNGNMYIKGGVVYAVGKGSPEVALDANTESGYKLYVSGGTLFAVGGLENGAQLTQSCYSASWNKNSWYAVTVGDKTYAFKTPSSGGNGLVVSAASKPELKSGVSVSGGESIFEGMGLIAPEVSGGSSVSLSGYSGGGGFGGGGFGPGW